MRSFVVCSVFVGALGGVVKIDQCRIPNERIIRLLRDAFDLGCDLLSDSRCGDSSERDDHVSLAPTYPSRYSLMWFRATGV